MQVAVSDEPRQLKRRLALFQIEQDRQRIHQHHAQELIAQMPAISGLDPFRGCFAA